MTTYGNRNFKSHLKRAERALALRRLRALQKPTQAPPPPATTGYEWPPAPLWFFTNPSDAESSNDKEES